MRVIKFGRSQLTVELTLEDLRQIEAGMGIAENEGQIRAPGLALLRQIEELERQMELENRNAKPLHP
jgi:hypothetical protein